MSECAEMKVLLNNTTTLKNVRVVMLFYIGSFPVPVPELFFFICFCLQYKLD